VGKWDWQVFLQDTGGGQTYLQWMLSAWGWTLSLAALSLIVALVVGSLMGILRTTPSKLLVFIGNAWTELFRNIPLLVQIFLWYHVIPSIFLSLRAVPSFVLVVFALGFFTSARIAEQVRAGIQSLPRGQRMAGTAMGLTQYQTYRHVILPQAFRIILPPLTSEFMNIIKNSSVALTIGLLELTGRARAMQEMTFHVFEAFAAATVLYLLTNLIVVLFMRWLESRVRVPGLIAVSSAASAGH
jgi:glutamate/aspartate transport system permease protein